MGCGGSKGGEVRNDNPEIDPIDVPDIDPNAPAPGPPPDMKRDIFKDEDYTKIDATAKQVARTKYPNYEALIRALTSDCTTDLQKARAIFVWLFHQDIYGSWYNGITDPHTPAGYMKLIKSKKGSYTTFYAILCRAADIPCNVLRGLAKGSTYEVGQEEAKNMDGAWCTLYLSKGWRLVHPLWAFFQDKAVFEQGHPPPAGAKRKDIQEFFWLVDPTKMICFCKPKTDPWQLLKSKWDQKKFMRSPRLTEEYFSCGLMLPKRYNAIIRTDTGTCQIDFDHQEFEERSVRAEVDLVDDRTGNLKPIHEDYVVSATSSSTASVLIRCPDKGRYIAEIYGGPQDAQGPNKTLPKIVEFRLECSALAKEPEPFPLNSDDGFGPKSESTNFGISEITPDSGIVYIKAGQQETFHIQSSQVLEIKGTLYHNSMDSRDLENHISVSSPDTSNTLDVFVPKEKNLEFGLEIAARAQGGGSQRFTTVATYLLMEELGAKKVAVVPPSKGTDGGRLREKLIAATNNDNIERLEAAIRDFERHDLADNGDLTRAKEKLIQLHKENLERTTKARKLGPLEEAIDQAKKSCVSDQLIHSKEYTDAETARRQLKRLRLYMHKVLELKKSTISEIHSYQRPRPLVHKVMKATFRLLGEPNRKLEDWSYIQTSMRRLGRNSMISRMRQLDVVDVKTPRVNDAENHLATTNKLLVRMCSAGAGTFYVWSNNMIAEHRGKGITEPQNIWSKPPAGRHSPQRTYDHQEQVKSRSAFHEDDSRSGDARQSPEVEDNYNTNPHHIQGGHYQRQMSDDVWDPNATG